MPRGTTAKVSARLEQAYEYIKSEICATTKQIIDAFDTTHSQMFYVLQMLRNQGLIEEYVIGKLSIWCIAGHATNDVYVGGALISVADLEHAICKILEDVRGHKVTIKPSLVADIIAKSVYVNPRLPLLLGYISDMLPIMLSNVEKTVFRDSGNAEFYVVDTCSICKYYDECPTCETLRKKLNC
jgi:hypothetical protein